MNCIMLDCKRKKVVMEPRSRETGGVDRNNRTWHGIETWSECPECGYKTNQKIEEVPAP